MKFLVKENPDNDQLFNFINEAFSKRAFLLLFACCKVKYEGRAVSRLGLGDRTMIIKGDGSFLIHQDRNLEPVNWQPPGTKFTVELDDHRLYLRGSRRNPKEVLEVEICQAYLASYHTGRDIQMLELVGYEEDMRDMIMARPGIVEEGFRPTAREYSTNTGFIDILGKDKNDNLMVLELKSRRAGVNAVKQLKRYLDSFVDHKKLVRGILVAPSVTEDALELLEENGMEFLALEPPMDLKDSGVLTLEDF